MKEPKRLKIKLDRVAHNSLIMIGDEQIMARDIEIKQEASGLLMVKLTTIADSVELDKEIDKLDDIKKEVKYHIETR